MQIAKPISNSGFPSSQDGGKPPADFASQLQEQQSRHRRIYMRRLVAAWWYPVLLTATGCLLAVYLSQNIGLSYPLYVVLGAVALPILVILIRNMQFSLLMFALGTTALAPKIVSIKSADIYPAEVFIAVLFCTLLVQAAFHVREVYFPALRALWPQLGLFVLGIISNVMVQLTWTHGVPRKINSNPIIYDEILGCLVFSFPLMIYIIVTMIVSTNERLIRNIQRIFIVVAVLVSFVVIYDFRRIGGDIYTFRFSEPKIFWMSLRAIAQLLALGCILAYARFLYATSWRQRLIYLPVTLLCLITVILTLENSWWLEVGVGLLVLTVIYSRRLLVTFGFLTLPFIPLLKAELAKLQSVKTDDAVRFTIWQDALRVWSKQRVLGVGPGNFWAYDQTFTNLPRALRNCNATGLCVAHNGYLQALGELGPSGLFFFVAFPVVIIVLASMLCYRSRLPKKPGNANIFASLASVIGLGLVDEPSQPARKKSRIIPFGYKRPGAIVRAIRFIMKDDEGSDRRMDHLLAVSCIALTAGSMVADFFAGSFFIPPRQISVLIEMPQVITSWIMWGLLMYRDQKWRQTRKKAKMAGRKVEMYPDAVTSSKIRRYV